ncbi:ABC transporter substrate-binding protein [Litchfieldella qijiaojingensis]|uniref:ABC transporter substrate-binding protein n=1 Tax=Litchfieldella qijiaojingensis TaxID=980347 RepID=A0ABQ2Z5C5_9GAMM|nr:zinc ABC transporter substrate-binding protein [Halomonas qijiaojingensis]GGY02226.1 ABC transporter substrate-binding protein [Halomonas qijiaojingensis]
MHKPLAFGILLGTSSAFALSPAYADEPIDVVASFSILADMAKNVGGEHVAVTSLVGPDSDTHVFSPSPSHARALAEADLVVFNGLQFEGWMERLIDSSDYAGPLVIATDGIETLAYHGHEHGYAHGHDEHDDEHGHDDHEDHDDHGHDDEHDEHDHGDRDPHAWQNLSLGKLYVANIRDGLIEADPDNAEAYRQNAERYINELEATDAEIRALIGEIPNDTGVVTGHDSFGYFSNAYGVRFLSPAGLSTEVDPSAADMAALLDVIHEQGIQALFHESMTNPSTIDQLAEEAGLPIAGTLYADALASEGEASTYLGMMRHNASVLHDALAVPGHDDDDREHSHDDDHDHGHDEHDHDHGHSH